LLPTPEVLAFDLKEIVHNLGDWEGRPLLALRSLPSVRFAAASDVGVHHGPVSNGVIPLRIASAIARTADPSSQSAARALFTFNTPTATVEARHEVASKASGITPSSFRKGAESRVLLQLAYEMFRGELAWAIYQFDPIAPRPGDWAVNSWCELLGFERSLVIDGDDPRVQTWTTTMRIRCITHDLPLLVTSQRWSGGGPDPEDKTSREPGVITVLPVVPRDGGPPRSAMTRLLDCRRYSTNALSFKLYLWSLGQIRPVGEVFEHSWQQVLVDKLGSFLPVVGFGTESYPPIERVRLRVKLPANIQNVKARHLVTPTRVSSAYTGPTLVPAAEPIAVKPDAEGYYTYEPEEVNHPDAYEIWWGSDEDPDRT
jgi:hypothetical protein